MLWAPSVSADLQISRAVTSLREREWDGLRYIDGRGQQPRAAEREEDEAEAAWVNVSGARGNMVRSVGMHKVLGDIVQGIVGGIFHQFVRTPFLASPRLAFTEISLAPFEGRLDGTSRIPHARSPMHPASE